MGYARYTVYRNGRQIEAGYDVQDVCNKDACSEKIDRGLAYLCGETPGGDEYGCGGYFCSSHLYISSRNGEPQMCGGCLKAADREATPA
ncbi:hypothetical protein [Nonomuraea sp. NPDC049646]|uniref:hypothetical protein n=1 Tax=unclassified Nonomuraea TaxID=2593643 RepID=UPI0037932CA8